MPIVFLVIVAVTLIAGPLVAPATGVPLSAASSAALLVTGVSLLLLAGILLVIMRLYQKTKSSEAFVRTGAGGVKVIRDGGALVIPVLHELIRVSLQTLKLEVSRVNEDALITQDKLRADIHA